MPIPESQLETWSHQGAVTTAKATHESVRNALSSSSYLQSKNFEVYLQGSYKNDTNIRGDSDVDIIVQLNSSFFEDLSGLSPGERELFGSAYSNASYGWADFRSDVLRSLRAYYGMSAITEGNKSLKITAASGRLASDVIVCLHYRKYKYFRGRGDEKYIDGICFYTASDHRQIISFPKPHYENGVLKNSSTNNLFKPSVRLFKNIRSYLVERGSINANLAPSYFLECLIYNVPNREFDSSYGQTFCNVVNFFADTSLQEFNCQDEQRKLFGSSAEQWVQENAKRFVDELVNLWNNWR